jgi:hypothetical protein
MFKITNITLLGTEYTVANQDGKIIKTIQVITHSDILNAALGKYDEAKGSVQQYMEKSIGLLCGFNDVDANPYKTFWYSTPDEEVVLSTIIEYAIKNGYDRVILEHLDELEE